MVHVCGYVCSMHGPGKPLNRSLRFQLHAVLYGYSYDVGDGFLQFYPLATQYYLCSWLNSFTHGRGGGGGGGSSWAPPPCGVK